MDNNRGKRQSRRSGGRYLDENQRRNASAGADAGYSRQRKKKLPVAVAVGLDVIGAALLLGIFYVTNYMIKTEVKATALPTPSAVEVVQTPAVTQSQISAAQTDAGAQNTPEATVDPNDWRAKFADKFTDGTVEKTDHSYKDANISITIQEVRKYDVTCYVADIYVADLKYFKTAFAKDPDVMGARELTDKVAEENGAILAINGDHCVDNKGTVVRNGQMYRDEKASCDFLVMNYDGTMQVFTPDQFEAEAANIKAEGAYQVWAFGPMLLQNGQPMKEFNSTIAGTGLNPRTAVGYYEPGHYCFVVVGGRQAGYSEGYTMEQLSQLMSDLGCAEAYNLDGGRSSEMIFMGKMLNQQLSGRRSTTDILYIGDQ